MLPWQGSYYLALLQAREFRKLLGTASPARPRLWHSSHMRYAQGRRM